MIDSHYYIIMPIKTLVARRLLKCKHSHTHMHSEEARSSGFSVVIDGDVIHDFLMRPMIKALATIQVRPHPPISTDFHLSG